MTSTSPENYLNFHNGDVEDYKTSLAYGHRKGQAFFNALHEHDQSRIRGTNHDTFFYTGKEADLLIERTIAYLLDTEIKKEPKQLKFEEIFLKENNGDLGKFWVGLENGYRYGEAWVNALSRTDQEAIAFWACNPYHYDGEPAIFRITDSIKQLKKLHENRG